MAKAADRNWTPALVAVGAAVVVAAVVAGVLAFGGDDDDQVATVTSSSTVPTSSPTEGEATTTTAVPTTTAASSTSAPSTSQPAPEDPLSAAVWPVAGSGVAFDDPQEAARSFAEEFVGFTDPVVGEFQAGDSRSGEVEVRPRQDGPVTTVLVRQLDDDGSWWVLGSVTPNITLEQPSAGETIDDPVTLVGEALAFEGTVQVEVRGDGTTAPLGEGFVTGSGSPPAGPFEGHVEWANPGGGWGALVLYTYGGEEPAVVWEATVVRVRFADDV